MFTETANMVLDLDLFRDDKGGCLKKVIDNQKKRFSDVKLVENVVESDNSWRKCKHHLSNDASF